MANPGVVPFDPTSDVGMFRVLAGDTEWVPLDPPVPGMGNYTKWSDAEIEVFLSSSDSMSWAIYAAYLQVATAAALESQSVADNDLRIDTTKRAEQLLRIAHEWRDRAQDEDEAGAEEGFELVPTGKSHGGFIPEGTIPQWGRAYTWAKWRG